MADLAIRKTSIVVEDIHHEGGPVAQEPLRRGAAMVVLKNPFAGRYEPEIEHFMDALKPLGLEMAQKLIDALGGQERIKGYGKGAIVGSNGELEHGALWHGPGGYSMRALIDGSKSIVPSSKKIGGMGVRLDVPITNVNASYVRSYFDSMEVGINDSPRADELMFVLVMTTGPRIHARSGGLDIKDVVGEDGLR